MCGSGKVRKGQESSIYCYFVVLSASFLEQGVQESQDSSQLMCCSSWLVDSRWSCTYHQRWSMKLHLAIMHSSTMMVPILFFTSNYVFTQEKLVRKNGSGKGKECCLSKGVGTLYNEELAQLKTLPLWDILVFHRLLSGHFKDVTDALLDMRKCFLPWLTTEIKEDIRMKYYFYRKAYTKDLWADV